MTRRGIKNVFTILAPSWVTIPLAWVSDGAIWETMTKGRSDDARPIPKGSSSFRDGERGTMDDRGPLVGLSPSWRLVVVAAMARASSGYYPTIGGHCSPCTTAVGTSTCWAKEASKFCSVVGGGGGEAVGSGTWVDGSPAPGTCPIWLMVNSCMRVSTMAPSFGDL